MAKHIVRQVAIEISAASSGVQRTTEYAELLQEVPLLPRFLERSRLTADTTKLVWH